MNREPLYAVLELRPGASLEEVKRAYRELAQVWHPDRFAGKPELQARAARNMVEINAAYRELVRHLRAAERAGRAAPTSPSAGSARAARSRRPGGDAPGATGVAPPAGNVGDQGGPGAPIDAAADAETSPGGPRWRVSGLGSWAVRSARRRPVLWGGAAFCLAAFAVALGGAVASETNQPEPALVPLANPGGHPLRLSTVSVGGDHSCGLTEDGQLFCWGANDAGQLGRASTARCGTDPEYACSPAPAAVAGNLRFRDVAVGLDHTCGLLTDGRAYCWGAGFAGQIGDGATEARAWPVSVAGDLRFQSLSALGQHTCGLTESGSIYCWGRHTDGELGDPSSLRRCRLGRLEFGCAPAPAPVPGWWAQVVAGASHSCGLSDEGRAYCWGSNRSGQLGGKSTAICPDDAGTHPCAPRPVPVVGGITFAALTAGAAHTCGLAADGTVYCWGRNDVGQLGTGSTDDRDAPALAARGMRFRSISAGGFHTCGVTRDNRLYCWGQNAFGQLGRASRERCEGVPCATEPSRVPLQGVAQAVAGFFDSCAITASQRLCWGRNDSGQIGNGEVRPSDAMVQQQSEIPAARSSGLVRRGLSALFAPLRNAWTRARTRATSVPSRLEIDTRW